MENNTSRISSVKSTTTGPGNNFDDITSQRAVQIMTSVINLIISFLILFNNGLVIITVAICRALSKNMYRFVSSLAIADSLVGFALLTFTISNLVLSFDSSNMVICSVTHILISTSLHATLLNLIGIAVERSLAINQPLRYHSYMTPRNITIIFALIWFFSITMGICVLAGRSNWEIEKCTILEIYLNWYKLYFVSYLSLMYIVLVIFYTQLFTVAYKQERRIATEAHLADEARQAKFNYRAVKTFTIVLGGFLLCWMPMTLVMIIYLASTNIIKRSVFIGTFVMASLNSIFNPIIYAFRNADMRKGFKKILHLPNPYVEPE